MELQTVTEAVQSQGFKAKDFTEIEGDDIINFHVISTIPDMDITQGDNTQTWSRLMLRLGQLKEQEYRIMKVKTETCVGLKETQIRLLLCPGMMPRSTMIRQTSGKETKILYQPDRGTGNPKKRKRCTITASGDYRLRKDSSGDDEEHPRKWGCSSDGENDGLGLTMPKILTSFESQDTKKVRRSRDRQRRRRQQKRALKLKKPRTPMQECTALMAALQISPKKGYVQQDTTTLPTPVTPDMQNEGKTQDLMTPPRETPNRKPTGKLLKMMKLREIEQNGDDAKLPAAEGTTDTGADHTPTGPNPDSPLTQEEEDALLWSNSGDEWDTICALQPMGWDELELSMDAILGQTK